MIDRTLIVSDLHLGNGGPYDIFAGGTELAAMLDAECTKVPTRVILNGDTVDFLLNRDALELNLKQATAQATALCSHHETAATLQALGRVLAAGGQVILRLGNHDAELALEEVQSIVRGALGQPPAIAARLRFERGETPTEDAGILTIDGARVLVTHGEENDSWNVVGYSSLPGPGGPEVELGEFTYSAGSRLVKTILNPLKQDYGMRFADLLKPDFQGAVLTALAVNPRAVRAVFQASTLKLLWQLFKQSLRPVPFAEQDDGRTGITDRVAAAGLSPEEAAALNATLGDAGPAAFAAEEDSATDKALRKLGSAGLKLYAKTQKLLVGKLGERYFSTTPEDTEWDEVHRLAHKFKTDAVIFGHTHSARFGIKDGVAFINTGTWIWLMEPPPPDATTEQWVEFLEKLRRNPGLNPAISTEPKLQHRLTAAFLDRHPAGGAQLALVEWVPGVGLKVKADCVVHIVPGQGAAR